MSCDASLQDFSNVADGIMSISRLQAEQLLFQEAAYLDNRQWDDWLALYDHNAEFWVPSWDDHGELTTDPSSQLSLIYYNDKARLEERVWRLRSGQSPASVPLSRTSHSITNIRVEPNLSGGIVIASNFIVNVYNPKIRKSFSYYGNYRHVIGLNSESAIITSKKISVMNDYLPAYLDFYTV